MHGYGMYLYFSVGADKVWHKDIEVAAQSHHPMEGHPCCFINPLLRHGSTRLCVEDICDMGTWYGIAKLPYYET